MSMIWIRYACIIRCDCILIHPRCVPVCSDYLDDFICLVLRLLKISSTEHQRWCITMMHHRQHNMLLSTSTMAIAAHISILIFVPIIRILSHSISALSREKFDYQFEHRSFNKQVGNACHHLSTSSIWYQILFQTMFLSPMHFIGCIFLYFVWLHIISSIPRMHC